MVATIHRAPLLKRLFDDTVQRKADVMKTPLPARLIRALAFAGAISSSSAGTAAACSHDHLRIEKQAVSVTLCPGIPRIADGTVRLPLQLRLDGRPASLNERLLLRYPQLAPHPRAVDDVDLTPLGIAKTLHLSLIPHGNEISIEHAVLLPGPILLR
jgi:hypothetical protein